MLAIVQAPEASAQQQQSFKTIMDKGYEIKTVTFARGEATDNREIFVVTLQKEKSVAVCYFAAACSQDPRRPSERIPPQILSFGCDGQRLLFSVTQPSGSEQVEGMQVQLARAITGHRPALDEDELAGGNVAPALRRVHQLVANMQPGNRLEVIAGWYLRTASASEFRQTTRSMNLFWRDLP